MGIQKYDVLVIGAGMAGLIGALEIALTGRSVAVIEARDRIGGRIYTLQDNGRLVELGAEFVHGNLPLTMNLLKEAGINSFPVKGSLWQHKDGALEEQEDFIEDYADLKKQFKKLEKDKPVADFLAEELADEKYQDLRASIRNYVEGYYAADTARASTTAMFREFSQSDDSQFRIEGGYHLLASHLYKLCEEKGVAFFLTQPVLQLQWKKDRVTAITGNASFSGKKVLITVPIGVLQSESITFFPALPQVKNAVKQLGYGHVLKLILRFEEPFWKNKSLTDQKNLADLSFLFSEEEIPTWWTVYPKEEPILTGWLGGPKAAIFHFLTPNEIQKKAINSLSHLFSLDVIRLQQQRLDMYYYNWSADPYSCGAYSYEVVGGGEVIRKLQQPVEQTLFFAGEGLFPGPEIGTVEGALQSGRDTAHRLIASFSA